MSGSPKYSYASLQAERRRQAEQARQLRQQEEAARRAAAERRSAEERRDRLRAQAVSQGATLSGTIHGLLSSPAARFLAAGVGDELAGALGPLASDAQSAPDEASAQAVLRRLNDLSARVRRLVAAASAADALSNEVRADLETAEGELNGAANGRAARFLPEGAAAAWRDQLERLYQAAASAGDVEALRQCLADTGAWRGRVRQAANEAEAVRVASELAATDLRRVRGQCDALGGGELRPFAESGSVERLEGRVGELETTLPQATRRDAVASVHGEVRATGEEVRQVTETAAAVRRAAHLDQEGQALARLSGEVAALDAARSAKFDAAGWSTLRSGLAAARAHLDRKELEAGREALAAARNTFAAHTALVTRSFARWQRERDQAAAAQAAAVGALDAVRQDPDRRRWAYPAATDIERKLKEVERQIERDEFAAAERLASEAAGEATLLAATTDQCKAEAARLAELKARSATTQPMAGHTFDVDGAHDLARYLDAAESALKKGRLDEATETLSAAFDRLESHERTAAAEAERWQKDHDEAEVAVEAAARSVAALAEDEVVGRWAPDGVAGLNRQVETARGAFARGRFSDAVRAVARVPAEGQALAERASKMQLQADLQAEIAEGVARVMSEMGFFVDWTLQAPDNPRSPHLLSARRDSGDEITASVEPEGRISYEIGGRLEKRSRVNRRGDLVRECDSAEEQIRKMHDVLRELGIDTTDLTWDGQPPPDDHETAVENPALAQIRVEQHRTRAARR